MTEQADRLTEYTRAYHEALETGFAAPGRAAFFPHHSERTELIAVIQASDGWAVFYLPAPDDPTIPKGYTGFDLSQYDLNRVCQSVSVHRLQVAPPLLGEPWNAVRPLFQHVEPIEEFSAPWMHDDIRAAAISGHLTSLPGMTISPIVHAEAGIRQYVVPGRVKIWAPVFNIPGVGIRRLFLWTHADFWWFPEKLDLTKTIAQNTARDDLLALQTLTSATPIFTPDVAQQDAGVHASDVLEAYCDEFLELLEAKGDEEEVIHQWLKDARHSVFLDPYASRIWSKLPFGDKVSDFVVRRADGTYKLIEIERANERILRSDNAEPTALFNHACQQVRDWQRYIRDNVQTVRSELDLADIDSPDGIVVFGRTREIAGKEAVRRWRDMKSTTDPVVYTYDELCDSVRALAHSLRNMLRGHP